MTHNYVVNADTNWIVLTDHGPWRVGDLRTGSPTSAVLLAAAKRGLVAPLLIDVTESGPMLTIVGADEPDDTPDTDVPTPADVAPKVARKRAPKSEPVE